VKILHKNKYSGNREKAKRHYEGEQGYMELLSDVLNFGCDIKEDRTGVGRRKIFGTTLRFDLFKGFPFPTIRPTPLKIAQLEFWAFLNGVADIHTHLSAHGVNIWEGNTTREFLDKRGLFELPVGHAGKAYGFQYTNFNGEYDENFKPLGGVNQIKETFDELKNNCFSSRIVTSILNPAQSSEMSLIPCWWSHQFLVTLNENGDKVLNLHANSRSNDILFGGPFNIQQFSLYLFAMSKAQNMIPGEFLVTIVDGHIYGSIEDLHKETSENHPASQIKYVAETLSRDIYSDPVEIKITKNIMDLESLLSITMNDIQIGNNYKVNRSKYTEKRPLMAV